jgi:hypothetical protein
VNWLFIPHHYGTDAGAAQIWNCMTSDKFRISQSNVGQWHLVTSFRRVTSAS